MLKIKSKKITKIIMATMFAMNCYGTAFADSHAALDGAIFENNTLTLNRVSGQNPIVISGIAGVSDVQNESEQRQNADIVSGVVENTNIILQKGDQSTITIDASSLVNQSDTYVVDGSYNSDTQTITLERNNNKENIDIKLDNIAKATDVTELQGKVTTIEGNITTLQGDVTNIKTDVTNVKTDVTNIKTDITNIQGDVTDLEGRVTTNEGNITTLQGDVTNIKTDITNIRGDVTDLEGRVTNNETNITNLQGEVLESGHMDGNKLVLVKNNQSTVEVDGIATTDDVEEVQQQVDENRENIQKESAERQEADTRLDNRLNGVEQEISDINGRLDRLDGKIEKGVALAIAHASLKPLDYDPTCKWSGAMGVGSYKGKNALAAGVFYRESQDVMYNISISTCQGETGVGAGFSFRFK